MRLIRCLLYGFLDYFGKGMKSFDVLMSDQELEVYMAECFYMINIFWEFSFKCY